MTKKVNDKHARLQAVMAEINKKAIKEQEAEGIPEEFRDKVILLGSDFLEGKNQRYSTGFPTLDHLFGNSVSVGQDGSEIHTKGLLHGRVYIIYGPQGAGKSTLTYQMMGQLLQANPDEYGMLIDIEGRFTAEYAIQLGIPLDRLVVIDRKTYIEKSFDDILKIVRSGSIRYIIMDSLHGGTNKDEFAESQKTGAKKMVDVKGTEDNYNVGNAAKKNNQFFRMVIPLLGRFKSTLLVIGQVRDSLDQYSGIQLTGGHGAKHAADAIIKLHRLSNKEWPVDADGKYIGFRTRISVEKAAGVSVNEQVELPYYNGKGFDEREVTLLQAVDMDIIEKKGGWYKVGEDKMQGWQAVLEYFANEENYQWLLEEMGFEVPTNEEIVETVEEDTDVTVDA